MRETLLPGGVLTRVAGSHIRIGTFQYFSARNDVEAVRALADHVIARHYPAVASAARPALALLEAVIARQAQLVAQWQLLGFIHGVMNTDNMLLSGETLITVPALSWMPTVPIRYSARSTVRVATPITTSRRLRSGILPGWRRHYCR